MRDARGPARGRRRSSSGRGCARRPSCATSASTAGSVDARRVARALGVGRLAAEQVEQFAARGCACPGSAACVISKSKLSSRCWDSAKSTVRKCSWMPSFSRLRNRRDHARQRRLGAVQELDHEGLALGVAQRAVAVGPAGLAAAARCALRRLLAQAARRRRCAAASDVGPNTAGGSLPRSGSSSASSSGLGRPVGLAVAVAETALARACTSRRTSAGSSTRSPSPAPAPCAPGRPGTWACAG